MAKRVVPEEKRRRRRPTRSGRVLSETLIVETALRLLREHGSTGLTARRLGLALDCDPSTLYRYFRGMDDLTLALGDALVGRALSGWRPTGHWRADLRALGLRIHAAYVSHPQAAVLTASRVSGRAHELAADEAVLDILRSAGFPPAETVRVYHAFIDTTLGFAALDAASLALPGDARRADEDRWRSTYARLPAATHPRIAEVAPLLAARMNTSAYPTALDMLLDSAAGRLRPPGGPGAGPGETAAPDGGPGAEPPEAPGTPGGQPSGPGAVQGRREPAAPASGPDHREPSAPRSVPDHGDPSVPGHREPSAPRSGPDDRPLSVPGSDPDRRDPSGPGRTAGPVRGAVPPPPSR